MKMIEIGDRIKVNHIPKNPRVQPFYDFNGFVYNKIGDTLKIQLENGCLIEATSEDVEKWVRLK